VRLHRRLIAEEDFGRNRTELRLALAAVGLLWCAFVALSVWSISTTSLTFDEPSYIEAGAQHLHGNFAANQEHPPLGKVLIALPVVLLQSVGVLRTQASGVALAPWFRVTSLLAGLATVVLCGWWAWRVWATPLAAVLSTGLAAFDPNLIANASVATLDSFLTFFMTLTLYLLWDLRQRQRGLLAVAGAGVALGCALATKAPAIVLLPFVLLFLLPKSWPGRSERAAVARQVLTRLALVLGVAVVTTLTCYGFTSPGAFLRSATWQLAHTSRGHEAFFMGEYSSRGWLLYYPAAMLFKTPVPTLIMIAIGIVGVIRSTDWRAAAALVVFPLLFITITALSYVNIGLRYVLPAYPPLIVAAGALGSTWWPRRFRAAPVAMVAATAISVALIAPDLLAYFNEAAGGPLHGPALLTDSNIDWGQDIKQLGAYQAARGWPTIYFAPFSTFPPSAYGVAAELLPSVPLGASTGPLLVSADGPQILAVSVTTLHGVYFEGHDLYRWLFSRKPFGRVGYSILLYDITDDAEAHDRLAEVRARTGDLDGVERERRKAAAIRARLAIR
jgi:hypothetical protein